MAWREEEHPRDGDGKFTDGNGSNPGKVKAALDRAGMNGPTGRFGSILPGKGEEPVKEKIKKRRAISVKEVRQSDGTYRIPTDMKVTFGGKEFLFDEPFTISDIITISKPQQLREQVRVSQSYGGKFGQWSKKAGNASVKIGGKKTNKQAHWYENPDGTVAGMKIIV